jgi:hypothetical protein
MPRRAGRKDGNAGADTSLMLAAVAVAGCCLLASWTPGGVLAALVVLIYIVQVLGLFLFLGTAIRKGG